MENKNELKKLGLQSKYLYTLKMYLKDLVHSVNSGNIEEFEEKLIKVKKAIHLYYVECFKLFGKEEK